VSLRARRRRSRRRSSTVAYSMHKAIDANCRACHLPPKPQRPGGYHQLSTTLTRISLACRLFLHHRSVRSDDGGSSSRGRFFFRWAFWVPERGLAFVFLQCIRGPLLIAGSIVVVRSGTITAIMPLFEFLLSNAAVCSCSFSAGARGFGVVAHSLSLLTHLTSIQTSSVVCRK
jgi:hypothetical protein